MPLVALIFEVIMSPVLNVPLYCGVTGCWQIASVHGNDCQNHAFHACNSQHAAQLRAFRAKVYDEGRLQREYWRENWVKYANLSKFG